MKYGLLMLACLSGSLVSAQSPETLQTFRLEYRLEFDTETAGVLGPELAAQVLEGNREIRQQVALDAPGKRFTVRTFSAATGAPRATELRFAQAWEIEEYRVDVKTTQITERGFRFTGTVAADPRVFLAPVMTGDPWSFEVSWREINAPTFYQIYVGFANSTMYVPGASGMFEYSAKPNRAPVVVLATPPNSVFQPDVQLDASATTDPDNDALTFYWRSSRGAVSLVGGDTSTPRVQFHSGAGRYDLVLTVTDARGAESETTVSVAYYGR